MMNELPQCPKCSTAVRSIVSCKRGESHLRPCCCIVADHDVSLLLDEHLRLTRGRRVRLSRDEADRVFASAFRDFAEVLVGSAHPTF